MSLRALKRGGSFAYAWHDTCMPYEDPYVACAPWIDDTDLCPIQLLITDCNGDDIPLVYPETINEMIQAVTNILFGFTCYRYPGLCTASVYPCLECPCSCHPCACGIWDAISLTDVPYPIQDVTEVSIDGVIVPPAEYELRNNRHIVKLSGDRWPTCNSMGLPDSDQPTVIVEFTYGREAPLELRMGAARLVEQLYKACNDARCDLPKNVRSVQRRGIEFDVEPLTKLLSGKKTGIDILDYALEKYGKCARTTGYDPENHRNSYRIV